MTDLFCFVSFFFPVCVSFCCKNNTKERIDFLEKNIPLGLTNGCEIANLCLYLIKYNNAITGQDIKIDGGYSLKGI